VGGEGLLSGAGGRHLPVEHFSNRTESREEASVVAEAARTLVGRGWTDFEGRERLLTLGDILVVAPFNAEVAPLKRRLPAAMRIGTVDKLPGQEAAVSIYSMATYGEDVPRRHGVPLQPEPSQRWHEPGEEPGHPGLQPCAYRRPRAHASLDVAGQRALPVGSRWRGNRQRPLEPWAPHANMGSGSWFGRGIAVSVLIVVATVGVVAALAAAGILR
jgi:hypothetical protein